MNIDIKLNKDFERTLHALVEEYGEDFEILNGMHSSQTNFSDFVDAFVDKNTADATIDSNANASHKDIASLRAEKGKPIDKIIAFNKIFYELKKKYGLASAKEWLKQEWVGAYYLHDAPSTSFVPYCYAYDLSRLAKEGLFFLEGYNNLPPKHLSVFIDDVIEYISFMSNRSSGAVGIPNILVWTYYFYKKDKEKLVDELKDMGITNEDLLQSIVDRKSQKDLEQNFQKLIYRLNQPFMRIDQSAFVNVSIFDKNYYEALFGGLEFPDGSFAIDYEDDFMEHQKIFMRIVSKIRRENMFTFPVLTYSLLYQNGKFQDEDFARWCSEHNMTWNDSNFFVGQDVTTLSNCCRLLSSVVKIKGFFNSIGGTELSIGSVKVNTINLVHGFYELGENLTEQKYLALLKKRVSLCCKTLDVVRHIIKRNIEKGLLPNYCEGGVDMKHQYCTVGILGLYELIDKFGYIETDEFGNKSYNQKGIDFAEKVFAVINEVKDNFTEDYSFNIESVPKKCGHMVL